MKSISPKVSIPVACSAIVTCVLYIASLAGVDVPSEVATALVTILIAIAGYFVVDPRRS